MKLKTSYTLENILIALRICLRSITEASVYRAVVVPICQQILPCVGVAYTVDFSIFPADSLQIKILIAFSFIGIEYPLMIAPVIAFIPILLLRGKYKLKTPDIFIVVLLLYALVCAVPGIIVDHNVLAFPSG